MTLAFNFDANLVKVNAMPEKQSRIRLIFSVLKVTWAVSVALTSIGSFAQTPDVRLPSDPTELRRYAIDRYHEQDYANAERGFYQYLSIDRQGAPEAIEYLRNILRKSGKVESTRQSFEASKMAGKLEPKYLVDPTAPGVLKSLDNPTQLIDRLVATFKAGGIPSAEGILLSQIFSADGYTEIGEYLVAQSEDRIRAHQTTEAKRQTVESVRPLQYRFPGLAESDRLLPFSTDLWKIIRFRKDDDATVRREALRFRPAVAIQFDSNAPEKSKGAAAPFAIHRQQALAQKLVGDFGYSSSPLNAVRISADYRLRVDRHPVSDFAPLNDVSHWGALTLSWWNATTTEIRARYDAEANLASDVFERIPRKSHGPSLLLAQRLGSRYQASVAVSVRQAIDLHQKGKHSTLELEAADLYGKRALHPFIRLGLLDRETALKSMREIAVTFSMGSQLEFSERSFLTFSPSYRFANLPSGVTHEQRRTTDVRLRYAHRFVDGAISTFAEALYRAQKSAVASFEYEKFRVFLGMNVALFF